MSMDRTSRAFEKSMPAFHTVISVGTVHKKSRMHCCWATVALCYHTVALSVLSVCNVGVLWPNGWMDQDETWHGGRPRPRTHCSPERGTAAPSLFFQPMSIVVIRSPIWATTEHLILSNCQQHSVVQVDNATVEFGNRYSVTEQSELAQHQQCTCSSNANTIYVTSAFCALAISGSAGTSVHRDYIKKELFYLIYVLLVFQLAQLNYVYDARSSRITVNVLRRGWDRPFFCPFTSLISY